MMLYFQALSSRRFQREFDRVNLHRPTEGIARGGGAQQVQPLRAGAYTHPLFGST
jgi:hypothetical protein